jgi:RNA polymerase sigma-70 factor (ECF subfamily)
MDEAAMVRELAPRARLYGLRHLGSAAAADDLAQTAMVVMIEALRAGKIREPERLPSFVLGTCRMLALEHKRGELRRRGLRETYGEDLAPAATRPASTVDNVRLGACLDGLAPRPRTIMVLSFYEDLDAEQIGAQLGMAPGTVSVARHRALAQLATCMGATEVAA